MKSRLAPIKELLLKAKSTQGAWRAEYIGKLQDKIWDEPSSGNEDAETILSALASDLNFYEPDERDRDETLGYYGDARLEEVLNTALEKIEGWLKNNA